MIENFWSGPIGQGFVLSISLIMAIGPQNTYVLRQGALGRHVLTVIVVCTVCDAILIMAGALGLSHCIACVPWLHTLFLWGGVVFIGCYALRSWRRAIFGGYMEALTFGGNDVASRGRVILTSIGFSLLNPHAILDTVILIGAVALRYTLQEERIEFAVGAIVASFIWFLTLGLCARLLRRFILNPIGSRIFDAIVGTIMLWILYNIWTSPWPECPAPHGI